MIRLFLDGAEIQPENPEMYLKSWDGYISPEGFFYLTKPTGILYWNGSFNIHEQWADEYLEGKWDRPFYSAKDALVEGYGWISVTFEMPGSDMPGPFNCFPDDKKRITEIQKQVLMAIYQARDADLNEYFMEIGEKKLELDSADLAQIEKNLSGSF